MVLPAPAHPACAEAGAGWPLRCSAGAQHPAGNSGDISGLPIGLLCPLAMDAWGHTSCHEVQEDAGSQQVPLQLELSKPTEVTVPDFLLAGLDDFIHNVYPTQ